MNKYWDYSKFVGAAFYFVSCSIIEAPIYFSVSTSFIVFLMYGIIVDIAKLNEKLDAKNKKDDERYKEFSAFKSGQYKPETKSGITP